MKYQIQDKETGKVYTYEIRKRDDGKKTLYWEGIVTYQEAKRLYKQLSKKYDWVKEYYEKRFKD